MLRRESLWALAPLAPYHHVETLANYKSLGMTNETDLDNALCKLMFTSCFYNITMFVRSYNILYYLIFIFMRCILCIIHMQNNCANLFCFVLLALPTNCCLFPSLLGLVLFTRCHWDTVEPGLNIMSHIGRSMPQDIFWQECLVRQSEKWYHGYI